jgi:hypothetical protein
MDGFRAFKYYTALKLHFTDPKFDVFVNRGRVRGTLQRFQMRNDRLLFEKLARQFPIDKEYIQYIASNLMYDNPDVVYQSDEGMANYKEFLRRRQSITRVFQDDLDTIVKSGAQYKIVDDNIPDVIQLLISKKITIETAVILNQLDDFIGKIESNHVHLMFGNLIMRIVKSTKFVKYDSYKVMNHYQNFIEEVKGTTNG